MKFSLAAAAAGLLSLASAAPSTEASSAGGLEARQSQATKMDVTNRYMYDYNVQTFIGFRNSRYPSYLIWTADGCSNSPDNPLGYPFLNGCLRHDFGYRNYKDQLRFTDSNRKKIDDRFLEDLRWLCDYHGYGAGCKTLAQVYYTAVRTFGASKRDLESAEAVQDEGALAAYNAAKAEWDAFYAKFQAGEVSERD